MPAKTTKVIRVRALRVVQDAAHPLFLFTLSSSELFDVADVSRVSRDDTGKLIGYQRAEVRRHVRDIVDYLDSKEVLFPNPIILALTSKARFTGSRGPRVGVDGVTAGTLEIQLPRNAKEKPAWIVDGQQRALALSKAKRQDLIVPVNAFIADDVAIQRDQFLRINNAKPLPRGLITELLPEVTSPLPAVMAARRLPSVMCDMLCRTETSPFYGIVRRHSAPPEERAKGVIQDTSIIKMLQESIESPTGCLFAYRNIATNETDTAGMWAVVVTYWDAVRRVFPEAWGKPPEKSRLMHGVGMRAMGRLMDRMMSSYNPRDPHFRRHLMADLTALKDVCRWTEGNWEGLGGQPWNELQNVPRHINVLSNFIIRAYLHNKSAHK